MIGRMVRGYGVVEFGRAVRWAYIVEGVWAESVIYDFNSSQW